MGRRIRPKTRPKTVHEDETGRKRIKIRRGRAGSEFEAIVEAAKKEAAKDANFKGFKTGKKAGVNSERKKTEKVQQQLTATLERLERHDVEALKLSTRLRIVEKALSSIVHTVTDNNFDTRLLLNLNSAGVRMASADEHGILATNKWKFVWGDGTEVVRDDDGVDRVTSTMQRHRLHPGRKIAIREMWPIWDSVPNVERPDIDPMQGMRGAWYYDTRRYSTHSSAMNAWRRHMHNKQTAQAERLARNRLMPEAEYEESDDVDEMIADSDAAYVDEDTPEYREIAGADAERRTRNMRNRINGFFRSCELESCSYWTRHYSDRQEVIDNEAYNDLNAFNRVCAHFAVPLYDWDNDNWAQFRSDVNYYLEVTQNGGAVMAGAPSTRRRRSRHRAVDRTYDNVNDRNRRRRGGYNRSNY